MTFFLKQTNSYHLLIIVESHYVSGTWWGKAAPIYGTAFRRPDHGASRRYAPGQTEGRARAVHDIYFSNVKCRSENGIYVSGETADLVNWTFAGTAESGENVCVLPEPDGYYLFNSPHNGINIKKSTDLQHWADWGPLLTLGQGQPGWEWAKGRLTAGAALDRRRVPGIHRYLLFFHGSGPLTEEQGDFDQNASIGVAWSTDLRTWHWPQEAPH